MLIATIHRDFYDNYKRFYFAFSARCFPCLTQNSVFHLNPKKVSEFFHLIVGNRIDARQMCGKHINLSRLFHGFNKSERFVQRFARAVNSVQRPDNYTAFLHLFGGGFADRICTAEHPGQNLFRKTFP